VGGGDRLERAGRRRSLMRLRTSPTAIAPYALFFLSGISGLVYQVVWVRQFGNVFGNTVHSAALVTAVFMLGLGVGSYLAGAWADRRHARGPGPLLTAYGGAEAGPSRSSSATRSAAICRAPGSASASSTGSTPRARRWARSSPTSRWCPASGSCGRSWPPRPSTSPSAPWPSRSRPVSPSPLRRRPRPRTTTRPPPTLPPARRDPPTPSRSRRPPSRSPGSPGWAWRSSGSASSPAR
jgi:hypothetical protein